MRKGQEKAIVADIGHEYYALRRNLSKKMYDEAGYATEIIPYSKSGRIYEYCSGVKEMLKGLLVNKKPKIFQTNLFLLEELEELLNECALDGCLQKVVINTCQPHDAKVDKIKFLLLSKGVQCHVFNRKEHETESTSNEFKEFIQ